MKSTVAAALTVALAALPLGTGCLSTTHQISRAELARLANTPPEQRGEHVRVVQTFAGDEPPAAPPVSGGTAVIIVGTTGEHHVDPVPVTAATPKGGLAEGAKNDSKAWLVLAAVAAVGFAATEGARYDGWVKIDPMQAVHLYGPNGQYSWVPLAQLTPETAAWAEKAYLREPEGPWEPLGRAPLDCQGFTYDVLLGNARIPSTDGTNSRGFIGHIAFGYFPHPIMGVLLDIGLGWRDTDLGQTIFSGRYALELQALPLAAGPVHVGAYGQVGLATRLEDTPMGDDNTGALFGGGLLMQLELTTRLAIMGRGGLTALDGVTSTDFALGLAIY